MLTLIYPLSDLASVKHDVPRDSKSNCSRKQHVNSDSIVIETVYNEFLLEKHHPFQYLASNIYFCQ